MLDTDTLEWVGEESSFGWDGDISYAPDGSQFASVVADWIRIWDGRTGAYQAGIPLPDATTGATVAYLPGGDSLLVSAPDGRTWTVDTHLAAWVERACRIAGRNLTQKEWKQFFPNRPYEITCPRVAQGQLITFLLRQPRPSRRLEQQTAGPAGRGASSRAVTRQ